MAHDRAFTRNTSDPGQLRAAERLERRRTHDRRRNLLIALQTEHGRAALSDILEDCGVFHSIWEPSAKIHYNAGKQDTGHLLQARIVEASEELYELMEREARARRKALDRETDAAHTPRAETGDTTDGNH